MDGVLSELQSFFISARRTIDMVFSAHHLQTCIQENMLRNQLFVHLTKAVNNVNREAFRVILSELGSPKNW